MSISYETIRKNSTLSEFVEEESTDEDKKVQKNIK